MSSDTHACPNCGQPITVTVRTVADVAFPTPARGKEKR